MKQTWLWVPHLANQAGGVDYSLENKVVACGQIFTWDYPFGPRMADAIAYVSIIDAQKKIRSSSAATCLFKIGHIGHMEGTPLRNPDLPLILQAGRGPSRRSAVFRARRRWRGRFTRGERY